MKTFAILSLFLTLGLQLSSAEAQTSAENIEIPSEVIATEIPEAKVADQNGKLLIQVGSQSYEIEKPAANDSNLEAFQSMSTQEQEAFQNKRRLFLGIAARALNLMKYGFGLGSIVKEKIGYQIEKFRDRQLMGQYKGMNKNAFEDFLGARERTLQQREIERREKSNVGMKERSHQIISSILKGLDTKLWQQAPLFTKSNEFGLVASGGLELLAGKRDKGWGGILEIGLSLGYNSETRSLVIQILGNREGYKSSPMPMIFLTGAVGKMGTYIANQKPGEFSHQGLSYYPPVAPAFSSITKDSFMSGLSSGLTWPPSPLGDILTYTDTLNQTALLRVSISPLQKGFVRLQSGLNPARLVTVLSSVKEALAHIRTKSSVRAPICAGLL